jgi:hypothetical protein
MLQPSGMCGELRARLPALPPSPVVTCCDNPFVALLPLQTIEKQLAGESGSKLDVYELDVTHEKSDALQDLAELQLAAVRSPHVQLAASSCARRPCTSSVCTSTSCQLHTCRALSSSAHQVGFVVACSSCQPPCFCHQPRVPHISVMQRCRDPLADTLLWSTDSVQRDAGEQLQ